MNANLNSVFKTAVDFSGDYELLGSVGFCEKCKAALTCVPMPEILGMFIVNEDAAMVVCIAAFGYKTANLIKDTYRMYLPNSNIADVDFASMYSVTWVNHLRKYNRIIPKQMTVREFIDSTGIRVYGNLSMNGFVLSNYDINKRFEELTPEDRFCVIYDVCKNQEPDTESELEDDYGPDDDYDPDEEFYDDDESEIEVEPEPLERPSVHILSRVKYNSHQTILEDEIVGVFGDPKACYFEINKRLANDVNELMPKLNTFEFDHFHIDCASLATYKTAADVQQEGDFIIVYYVEYKEVQ